MFPVCFLHKMYFWNLVYKQNVFFRKLIRRAWTSEGVHFLLSIFGICTKGSLVHDRFSTENVKEIKSFWHDTLKPCTNVIFFDLKDKSFCGALTGTSRALVHRIEYVEEGKLSWAFRQVPVFQVEAYQRQYAWIFQTNNWRSVLTEVYHNNLWEQITHVY